MTLDIAVDMFPAHDGRVDGYKKFDTGKTVRYVSRFYEFVRSTTAGGHDFCVSASITRNARVARPG